MKNVCMKWKDQLLEAALGESAAPELQNHLSQCADCAAELAVLKARRERLDKLLPKIATAEEPSPALRARIIAAVEASNVRRQSNPWGRWALAGAATVILIGAVAVRILKSSTGINEADLRSAQALAEWRAPTDVLLRLPGQQWLNSTPRLGESYINMPTQNGKSRK
jgi:anti-sigma factor RsiW